MSDSTISIRVPKYCRQRDKVRGDRAFVRINGQKIPLGKYGSPESREKYAELIGKPKTEAVTPSHDPTVAEIMASYLEFAKTYYVKNGTTTREYEMMLEVCKMVRSTCSTQHAREFGPKRLKQVRQAMVDKGHSRKYINGNVDRIRRLFKWAAGEELISGSVHQDLTMVTGLRRGRTIAPDRPPVLPVDDVVVEAVLPFLPEVIADMVRLQRATGMRPMEVRLMRPADIDRTGSVWIYRVEGHKMAHTGRERIVLIGPKGQAVLLRYLARDAVSYCFCPADSEKKRRAQANADRKTPLSCGNVPGSNRVENPQKQPGEFYTKDSYIRAVRRACKRAGVPHFTPNQLRHSAATQIRREFGLEGSQVILGHSQMNTTEIYAEKDLALGLRIAAAIG